MGEVLEVRACYEFGTRGSIVGRERHSPQRKSQKLSPQRTQRGTEEMLKSFSAQKDARLWFEGMIRFEI